VTRDPRCECGHLASKHGYDRGTEVEYQGCFFDFRTCSCPKTVMDVARRAALIEAAEWFRGQRDRPGQLTVSIVSSELRRMAGAAPEDK
jgi:hypothetical protein